MTRRVVQHVWPTVGESVNCIYNSGFNISGVITWFRACFKLFWNLLTFRSEVIYVVCSRTMFGFIRDLPALILAFFGKRVVIHCHGSDLNDLLTKRWFSVIVQSVYRRCEIIVPCRNLRDNISDKVLRVHLCENFFGGHGNINCEGQDHSRLLVVWNSNIMASKGFWDVLSAIDNLTSLGYAIDLLAYGKIIGDNEMSVKDIQQALQIYQDRDWFSYLGSIEHSEALKKLKSADVVILPSRYSSEMQPLAIIEGMCSAKQIIVSNTKSLKATVGDYPANFVPVNDVVAISECLERLCREKIREGTQFLKNLTKPR